MRKIYFKLILVVSIAATAITLLALTFIFVRFQERRMRSLNPRETQFLHFLTGEILDQPTAENVKRIADTYALRIKVDLNDVQLNSDPEYFNSPEFLGLTRHQRRMPNPRWERGNRPPRRELRQGKVFVLLDGRDPVGIELVRDIGRLTFVKRGDDSKARVMAFVIPITVIFVFVILAFLVKRWLADPLKELEVAIRAFPESMEQSQSANAPGDLLRLFDAFGEMKKQVRQAFEDKERLLRDVSHDLKSPITRMRLAAEMLPESTVRNRILSDLTELHGLVNQVLEVQRRQNFKREVIDIESFLHKYLARRKTAVPISIEVNENFTFQGNHEYLTRIMDNLIDNSIKYADTSKGITVTCSQDEGAGVLAYSDSGSGISTDIVDHIFEPFFKEDVARRQDLKSGFGLGLSICRSLVESMDGKIQASQSSAGGLMIRIEFPSVNE